MLLQCDPTVVFALKRNHQWSGRLLRIHWQFDDPYNTYRFPGLPPGPINSPGQDALEAALNPAEGEWKYFVTVDLETGETRYAETLEEHNRNVAEAQANGYGRD